MRLLLVSVLLILGCKAAAPDPEPPAPEPPPPCPPRKTFFVEALLGLSGQRADFKVPGPLSESATELARLIVRGPQGELFEPERVEVVDELEHGNTNGSRSPGSIFVHFAKVTFTPPSPGRWRVSTSWTTGEQFEREIVVARPDDSVPTFSRRFVDRMDDCTRGPFHTRGGLTFCQRGSEVWVYRADGTIDQSFAGEELVVIGDEVWTNTSTELEHRSDVQGQLRFDGAVSRPSNSFVEGETMPGVAFRANGSEIREVRWNGSQLTSVMHAGLEDFEHQLLIYEGAEIWSGLLCHFERGCSQTACPSVQVCDPSRFSTTHVTADALWQVDPDNVLFPVVTLRMMERPLGFGRSPLTQLISAHAVVSLARAAGSARPHFMVDDRLILPRRIGSTFELVALRMEGKLLTVTDDWVIAQQLDPFTLTMTPPPP